VGLDLSSLFVNLMRYLHSCQYLSDKYPERVLRKVHSSTNPSTDSKCNLSGIIRRIVETSVRRQIALRHEYHRFRIYMRIMQNPPSVDNDSRTRWIHASVVHIILLQSMRDIWEQKMSKVFGNGRNFNLSCGRMVPTQGLFEHRVHVRENLCPQVLAVCPCQ